MPENDPQIGWVTFFYSRGSCSAYSRCFHEDCRSDGMIKRAIYKSQIKDKFSVKCSVCGETLYFEEGLPFIFNAEMVSDLTEIEIISSMF